MLDPYWSHHRFPSARYDSRLRSVHELVPDYSNIILMSVVSRPDRHRVWVCGFAMYITPGSSLHFHGSRRGLAVAAEPGWYVAPFITPFRSYYCATMLSHPCRLC